MLKKTIIFLSAVSLIFVSFFIWLLNGIKIDKLSFDNIEISQLYLKIDKKLILSIDKVYIEPSIDNGRVSFDPSLVVYANEALQYFSKIQIKDIFVSNEHLFFEYKENQLYVKHKSIIAKLDYRFTKGNLQGNLQAQIIPYKINIESKINGNIYSLAAIVQGKVQHSDITVPFHAKIRNNMLFYKLSTLPFENLEFISSFTTLEPNLQDFLYEKLKVKSFQINELYGKILLDKLDKFDINSVTAKITINDAAIKYDEKLPQFKAEEIVGNLKNGKISLDIRALQNPKAFVTYNGNVSSDIDFKEIVIDGEVRHVDFKGMIYAVKKDDKIKYNISSKPFKSISFIETFITLPKAVKQWSIQRLKASSYQIKNAEGTVFLPHFHPDLKNFKATLVMKDILLNFKDEVTPLKAKLLDIDFKQGDLYLTMKSPKLDDIDLQGSKAVINNLLGKEKSLRIDLQSISPINDTLIGVLSAYKVDLPLKQIDGNSKLSCQIIIPFSKKKVKISAKVDTNKSNFKIKDQTLFVDKLDLTYKNRELHIKDSTFVYDKKVIADVNTSFYLESKQLNINALIYDNNNTFQANITSGTNFNTKLSSGKIGIEYVKYGKYLNIKNKTIPYTLSFGDNVHAYFPTANVSYHFKNKEHRLIIESLTEAYKFIPVLDEFEIAQGNIEVRTENFDDFKIYSKISGFDLPVYRKGEQLKTVELDTEILDKSYIHIKSPNKFFDIKIDMREELVVDATFKHLGFYIDVSKENNESNITKKKQGKKEFRLSELTLPMITITATDGFIGFNGRRLDYNSTKIYTNDKIIDFDLNFEKSKLYFRKFGDKLLFKASNITDKVINNLVGKTVIEGGLIDITAHGENEDNITGTVSFKNTNIKDIAVVNRIMAFLNFINPLSTIQTTARLAASGFKLSGYKAKEGLIKYNYKAQEKMLDLYSIYTKGDMADFDANAKIDLKNKTIDSKIKIIFMKDYSTLVGAIPILNYIVLGDDKNVAITADITGKLSDPNIETHLTKETTHVPVNILKRIIMLPAKAVDLLTPSKKATSEEKTSNKSDEHEGQDVEDIGF